MEYIWSISRAYLEPKLLKRRSTSYISPKTGLPSLMKHNQRIFDFFRHLRILAPKHGSCPPTDAIIFCVITCKAQSQAVPPKNGPCLPWFFLVFFSKISIAMIWHGSCPLSTCHFYFQNLISYPNYYINTIYPQIRWEGRSRR